MCYGRQSRELSKKKKKQHILELDWGGGRRQNILEAPLQNRAAVLQPKLNSILLRLEIRNPGTNPPALQHNTLQNAFHSFPTRACVLQAWARADGSPLAGIRRNLLLLGEKTSTQSPTNAKSGEVQPTPEFGSMLSNSFANRSSKAPGEHMLLVLGFSSAG